MPEPDRLPIVEAFALGPFATNCYVVSAPPEAECWIVDAGFDPGPMIDRVRDLGLQPVRVVLTHAHVDHIAGLDEVRRAFPGVPVCIHEAEEAWLGDPELNLSGPFGQPISLGGPDELLRGGEELELAGTRFRVLHTPGHSPGGITLHHEGAGLALVGDTLFFESVGRFDFPTSSWEDLERSIREVLYVLAEETAVHPGHGPPTTVGHEKRGNPLVRGVG